MKVELDKMMKQVAFVVYLDITSAIIYVDQSDWLS